MKKFLKNITLALAATLLTLIALEVGLRFLPDDEKQMIDPNLKFFVEYDEFLGWRNKPGAEGPFQPNPKVPPVKIKINEHGMRGFPTSYGMPDDWRRIMTMGDSLTFGYGLEYEDTWPNILSDIVPPKHEVINAGVIGYGTDQEYLYMEKEIQNYVIHYLVILISGNDIYDTSTSMRYGANKPYFVLSEQGMELQNVPVPKQIPIIQVFFRDKPLRRILYYRSAIYRFIFHRTTDLNELYDINTEVMDTFQAMAITQQLLTFFKEDCETRNTELLAVVIPQKGWLKDNFRRAHEGTLQVLQAAGVRHIDLWDDFKAHMDKELFLPDDVVHTTRLGNEIIARAVNTALFNAPASDQIDPARH